MPLNQQLLCLKLIAGLKLIQDHLKEMFSIIYTPTEGEAIANFSRIFRKPEGCFLNINDVDRVDEDLSRWGDADKIDLIVVSDGEQVRHRWFLRQYDADKFDSADSWNWRSRCWRNPYFSGEARFVHSLCWNPSLKSDTSCA